MTDGTKEPRLNVKELEEMMVWASHTPRLEEYWAERIVYACDMAIVVAQNAEKRKRK